MDVRRCHGPLFPERRRVDLFRKHYQHAVIVIANAGLARSKIVGLHHREVGDLSAIRTKP